MSNEGTPKPLVSWFTSVTAKKPLRNMPLEEIYECIVTDFLKVASEKVKANPSLKKELLPSFTASGTFSERKSGCLLTYSGYIVLDFDHCDLKYKGILAEDKVLHPVLVFTSPSGKGIKMVVNVKNGTPENHLRWFNAISLYLLNTYGLTVDSSGSDLARLCFLCTDKNAFFSYDGSVDGEKLPEMLPVVPNGSDAKSVVPASRVNPVRLSSPSVACPDSPKPSDDLNRLPQVHERALRALINAGWKQDPRHPDLWVRPGKELKEGISAKYNLSPSEGIWFFTCFSSNGGALKRKGYTDVQLICELEYGGDWQQCIKQLTIDN
jgi:hypothetical protein